jgi:prophage maintenance system killer protein
VFLELNGVDVIRAGSDDVYDLVMEVAAGQLSVEEIAEGLQRIIG